MTKDSLPQESKQKLDQPMSVIHDEKLNSLEVPKEQVLLKKNDVPTDSKGVVNIRNEEEAVVKSNHAQKEVPKKPLVIPEVIQFITINGFI